MSSKSEATRYVLGERSRILKKRIFEKILRHKNEIYSVHSLTRRAAPDALRFKLPATERPEQGATQAVITRENAEKVFESNIIFNDVIEYTSGCFLFRTPSRHCQNKGTAVERRPAHVPKRGYENVDFQCFGLIVLDNLSFQGKQRSRE
jgi:hypothetical protein